MERFVSVVRVGEGDGEVLIALAESGRTFTGRPGRKNRDQWRASWDHIEWTENKGIGSAFPLVPPPPIRTRL